MRRVNLKLDLKAAPVAFEMNYTPKYVDNDGVPVRIYFVKRNACDRDYLVGIPVNSRDEHVGCGCILVDEDTRVNGGRAMSYIAKGGRSITIPSEDFRRERDNFCMSLWQVLQFAARMEPEDQKTVLQRALSAAFCFDVSVVQGSVTEITQHELQCLGAHTWIRDVLVSTGLTVEIDANVVAAYYTQSHKIGMEEGEWDSTSDDVTLIHAIPEGVVTFLQSRGVRYTATQAHAL